MKPTFLVHIEKLDKWRGVYKTLGTARGVQTRFEKASWAGKCRIFKISPDEKYPDRPKIEEVV